MQQVTEPDQALTRLRYDAGIGGAVRGLLGTPVTLVTDPREHPTETRMNRYGASVRVTDPASITDTAWDPVHLMNHGRLVSFDGRAALRASSTKPVRAELNTFQPRFAVRNRR